MSVLVIAAVNTGVAYGLIRLSTVSIPAWLMRGVGADLRDRAWTESGVGMIFAGKVSHAEEGGRARKIARAILRTAAHQKRTASGRCCVAGRVSQGSRDRESEEVFVIQF